MGWTSEIMQTKVGGNAPTIVGTIGDKLTIVNVGTFRVGEEFDFTGHTWVCQIRHAVDGPLIATMTLTANDTSPTEINLTWELVDTSVLTPGREYLVGMKATAGTWAPWTLERGIPLVGYAGVVSDAP